MPGLPEVLLCGPVILQLLPDALKLSLQVRVAQGNRRSLRWPPFPAGPRLNGGIPGASRGPSAHGPQGCVCSIGARAGLRPGACEVPREEQVGVGDTGQG